MAICTSLMILSSLVNIFPYVPLPDVNSELFFKTHAVKQPMEDVLDAFPWAQAEQLVGLDLLHKLLFLHLTIWILILPSCDRFLTQTLQHTSARSSNVITGQERKKYVGHYTSLSPGMISTIYLFTCRVCSEYLFLIIFLCFIIASTKLIFPLIVTFIKPCNSEDKKSLYWK